MESIFDFIITQGTDNVIAQFAKNNILLTWVIIQIGIYIASKTKNTLDDKLWGRLRDRYSPSEDEVIELTNEVKKKPL